MDFKPRCRSRLLPNLSLIKKKAATPGRRRGVAADLQKAQGGGEDFLILELQYLVSRFLRDRVDRASANAQIAQFACRKCLQFGHCLTINPTLTKPLGGSVHDRLDNI
jgi:hypothetical protein